MTETIYVVEDRCDYDATITYHRTREGALRAVMDAIASYEGHEAPEKLARLTERAAHLYALDGEGQIDISDDAFVSFGPATLEDWPMTKPNAADRFDAAALAMERRTRRTTAFIIIDPVGGTRASNYRQVIAGRVVLTFPADGVGRVRAVAWMPYPDGPGPGMTPALFRHAGHASGGGYDKATAAMRGARYVPLGGTEVRAIGDSGADWKRQLEDAGYVVAQAV